MCTAAGDPFGRKVQCAQYIIFDTFNDKSIIFDTYSILGITIKRPETCEPDLERIPSATSQVVADDISAADERNFKVKLLCAELIPGIVGIILSGVITTVILKHKDYREKMRNEHEIVLEQIA
jgi:hypothetical protein